MDGFCSYHSGYIIQRIQELYPNIIIYKCVSDYLYQYIQIQQQEQQDNANIEEQQPLPYRRPHTIEEVYDWVKQHNLQHTAGSNDTKEEIDIDIVLPEFVGVYCESDSGLNDVEELRTLLNVTCYDIPIIEKGRRYKQLMYQIIKSNNLTTCQQQVCTNIDEIISFTQSLYNHKNNHNHNNDNTDTTNEFQIVIKPIRGVASESVSLCTNMSDIITAYNTITSSQIFGTHEYHTSVLVQEYLNGTEYAIDVVSCNGQHKVIAIWRYEKYPSSILYNNAPFCYYRTELIDETMIGNDNVNGTILYETICQYVIDSLNALGIRYGITHNEIIVPYNQPYQPYLIEINCRQHNMDFLPIVMNCIGYNIFDIMLIAYFENNTTDSTSSSNIWDSIPDRPTLHRYGCMVHLVNTAPSGILIQNHHLNEMMQLSSVYDAEVYENFCTVGSYITPTIDIRTDAGWVQLIHDDPIIIQKIMNKLLNGCQPCLLHNLSNRNQNKATTWYC